MATNETIGRPVSEVLRCAIGSCGYPVASVAKWSGVNIKVIGRFLRDDGLPLEAVDALARVLELELRPADRSRG